MRPEYDEETDVYRCPDCGVDVEQTGAMYDTVCWNCRAEWALSPADVIIDDGGTVDEPPPPGVSVAQPPSALPRKRTTKKKNS